MALNRLVEPGYEIDLVIGSSSGSLGCIREYSHELFYFYVVRRNGVVRLHALPQRLARSGHTSELCAGLNRERRGCLFITWKNLLRNECYSRSLHRWKTLRRREAVCFHDFRADENPQENIAQSLGVSSRYDYHHPMVQPLLVHCTILQMPARQIQVYV